MWGSWFSYRPAMGWEGAPLDADLIAHLVPIPWKKLANWYERRCKVMVVRNSKHSRKLLATFLKTRSRLHYYRVIAKLKDILPNRLVFCSIKKLHHGNLRCKPGFGGCRRESGKPRLEDVLPESRSIIYARYLPSFRSTSLLRIYHLSIWNRPKRFGWSERRGPLACGNIGGSNIGEGCPGSMYREVSDAWKELVKFDFQAHAKRLASKS